MTTPVPFRKLLVVGIFLTLSAPLFSQPAERDLPALLKFEYGQDRRAFLLLEEEIRKADPKGRESVENALLEVLSSAKATPAAKQEAALLLPRAASTCRSVPILASLIPNPETSHGALYALQGLPCPEASLAIKASLPQLARPQKLDAIHALGFLRDKTSLPFLTTLVKDTDEEIARAAISAIGRIGGEEAAKALKVLTVQKNLQETWTHSYLLAANDLETTGKEAAALPIFKELFASAKTPAIRAAALGGISRIEKEAAASTLVKALQSAERPVSLAAASFLNELPGPAVTSTLVTALPTLQPSAQLLLISTLETRGDASAVPVLLATLKSADPEVRLAGTRALGALGDHVAVPPLMSLIQSGTAESQTAMNSLRQLRGDQVDPAIAGYSKDTNPKVRSAAIRLLAGRQYKPALPTALAAASDSDASVRLESWRALNDLAGPETLTDLIDRALKISSAREMQAAEQAIQTVAQRNPDRERQLDPILGAMAGKTPEQRSTLLRLAGKIGGPKGMEALRAAAKDDNPEVRDTAIRTLAEWGDQTIADDLIGIIRSSQNDTHQILALRGYVRLAMSSADRTPESRLPMLAQAMTAARTVDGKKLVLGAYGNVQHPGALEAVEPFLANTEVRSEAEAAYLKIASSIARPEPEKARAALNKLASNAQEETVRSQAKEALEQLGKR